ncbi:MAG: Wzz/FepE/Etk N-terminal domain-containing protein [Pseudomonadota bacterium]
MFLRSIFEVLWARRVIVVIPTVCALVGGGVIATTSAPRYQASAKVILDYIKPDPITGEYVNSKQAQAYVNTQVQTIRDFQVAVPAAEALGLLDNIDLQTAYSSIPGGDPADFPRWVARRIIASTGVRMLPETNIIEIINSSTSPDGARQYVDAIRTAYIEASVDAKRAGASSGADNLTQQARIESAAIIKLQTAKRQIEDVHGVMPALEAARLSELVSAVRPLYVEEAPRLASVERLTHVEAQLAEASKALGPNHPSLQSLRATRDFLARQVQQERTAASSVGAGAALAERARQSAIEVQKDKVLSQRQLALELRLINEEIERRSETLAGLNQRIAGLRQLTAIQQVNLTRFGDVEVNNSPVFPNPALILGGAAFLGFTLGSLLALFIEFMNRRARRPQHVEDAVGAPMWGAVPKMDMDPQLAMLPRRRGILARRTAAKAAA